MTQTRKPTLCVDFDGVIHAYTSPWTNAETISDGPVPGALRWLWKATEWFEVVIYSSRSKTMAGCDAMLVWMMEQSRKEFGADHPMCNPEETTDLVDSITRGKYPITFAHEKPAAFLTIDDRAICFEGDWGEIDPADLLSFKPWNKRERMRIIYAEPLFAENGELYAAQPNARKASAELLGRAAGENPIPHLDVLQRDERSDFVRKVVGEISSAMKRQGFELRVDPEGKFSVERLVPQHGDHHDGERS
jgi:hypothetical protein